MEMAHVPSQEICSSPELIIVRQLPTQKSTLVILRLGGSGQHLRIEIVVVIHSCLGGSPERRSVRPLDVQRAVPTRGVLVHGVELLPELVELRQVIAGHGAPSSGKGLLEVLPPDLARSIFVHGIVTRLQLICRDRITNRGLGRPLAELSQVCTAEAFRLLRNKGEWNIRSYRRLLQSRLKNALPGWEIRQGNVDELIQTTRPQQCLIQQLRAICGADEKDVLLHADAINLGQQL